jgi:hypothetical protein
MGFRFLTCQSFLKTIQIASNNLLKVRNHYSENSTGPQNAVALEEKGRSVLPRKMFKKM